MFREQGIDFERVNYFNEPLTEAKLKGLLKKMDMTPIQIARKGEAIYKELGISADTPADELIKLIVAHPNLLQRPIVEVGDKAVMARPIEKALGLVK